MDIESAKKYLAAFGYLNTHARTLAAAGREAEDAAAETATSDAVRAALVDFQRFAGLAPTGTLDEPTARAMERPRCGMPDRGVRGAMVLRIAAPFVASGNVWPKAIVTWGFQNHGTTGLTDADIEGIFATALGRWADLVPLVFRQVDAANADLLGGSSRETTAMASRSTALAPCSPMGSSPPLARSPAMCTTTARRRGSRQVRAAPALIC